jgi:hypothetical protein
MIILILCGFFLCALNLTLFPHCQKNSPLFQRSLATPSKLSNVTAPSKLSNVTTVVSSTMSPLMNSLSPVVVLWISCPYTSLQNGKAKYSLCTINNIIRSLLFRASMPARYWVEGLHTATYLLNRLPCKVINASCPYVTLYGVTPSYEHLRVFSCVCYRNLSAQAAHKLAPGPLIVSSSDTLLIIKDISVLISSPTTSSSFDMFLMSQSFPSLPCPI